MSRLRADQIAVVAIIAFAAAMLLAWVLPASPPPAGKIITPGDVTTSATTEAPTTGTGSPSPTPSSSPTRTQVKVPPPTSRRAPHRSTSPPPVRQTDPDVVPSYPSCLDVRLDHPEGVEIGHPAYRPDWDTDHDGWACDPDDLPLTGSTG